MGALISSQVGALVASTYAPLCSTFLKKNMKESQEKGFLFFFLKKGGQTNKKVID